MCAQVTLGVTNHAWVMIPRLHEAIVKALIKDISSGDYAPGSTLPTENDLAEAHGVSRTAAREVMRTLRTLGLVEIRRRKGASVLPRRDWNMLDPTVLSLTIENASDLEKARLVQVPGIGINR